MILIIMKRWYTSALKKLKVLPKQYLSRLLAVVILALGVGALYTFFSNGVTWALGCNRAAAEAAMEGELPRIFALESRMGTPLGAALLMGAVSTVVLVLYGFLAGSNEDLFWSLFAFSAVIFLLPYQGMFLAFIKMRLIDPDHPRPYRVPGGIGTGLDMLCGSCHFYCVVCIYPW